MRHAKQRTAHAGRRRLARSKNNNGRLLGSKDWQDHKIIVKFSGRIEDALEWQRDLGLRSKGRRGAALLFKQPSHHPLALDDTDIPVRGEVGELFDSFTWCRPTDLDFIDLYGGADAEDFPKIM